MLETTGSQLRPQLHAAAVLGRIPNIEPREFGASTNTRVVCVDEVFPSCANDTTNRYRHPSHPMIDDLGFILFTIAKRLVLRRIDLCSYEGSNRHNRVSLPSVSFVYSKMLRHFWKTYAEDAFPSIYQTALKLYNNYAVISDEEARSDSGAWRLLILNTLNELAGNPTGSVTLWTGGFSDNYSCSSNAEDSKLFLVYFERRVENDALFSVKMNHCDVELYKLPEEKLRAASRWNENIYIIGKTVFFACGQHINREIINYVHDISAGVYRRRSKRREPISKIVIGDENTLEVATALRMIKGAMPTTVKFGSSPHNGDHGARAPEVRALRRVMFGARNQNLDIANAIGEDRPLRDTDCLDGVSKGFANSIPAGRLTSALYGSRFEPKPPSLETQ